MKNATAENKNSERSALRLLGGFLISNWAIITGLVGGGFAFYKFILDRSVPANIQLSLDASVVVPKDKTAPVSPGTSGQGQQSRVVPVTFSVKASNDSHFRDLKIHDNHWFAYGWKYVTEGSSIKPGPKSIYDLHRQAEYIYGGRALYEQHLEQSDQLTPSEKAEYLQEIEAWEKTGKLPPGRIDDPTKRRLADHRYVRELIGVGSAFSPRIELKPGQQIQATHVMPMSQYYDAVEIRVFIPTSEPGRRQDWLGLIGKTDKDLIVELMTFDPIERARRSNPRLVPRMCNKNKTECASLSEQQMKNIGYQSQVIVSQIWIPK